MNKANKVLLKSMLLASLLSASFYSPAEKFLKPAQETINSSVAVSSGSVVPPPVAAPEHSVTIQNTEWIDSGLSGNKNEYRLLFTKESPKIDSTLKVKFSFIIQLDGDKKVEISDKGKPSGMFFNQIMDTWYLDCLDFSGHLLSRAYMLNDNMTYSRKLDTRKVDINKVEKTTAFPGTDIYHAAKYYCGR